MAKIRTSIQRNIWVQLELDEQEAIRIADNNNDSNAEFTNEFYALMRQIQKAIWNTIHPNKAAESMKRPNGLC